MKISKAANKIRINTNTKNKIVNFTNSARDIAKISIKEASREGGKVLILTASTLLVDKIARIQ